jgi:valyl-tRNA synthetase
VIATTRPETMFVDTTVFVHPNDQRYKKYIGKYAINPINNQPLPIMADAYIDQKFGTGVMKCTPAHDFNDYALAKKYQITNFASVIDEDGKLNQLAKTPDGNFTGIDRLKARNKIVEYLTKIGKVEKIEDYTSNVGYSERSNEVIEPLLSKQ